ncbi:hypothetical protein IKP85_00725 [bacterium]|nr:hypothetical protein [bacterium]
MNTDSLKLNCIAIGSMPHKNLTEAFNLVINTFGDIPFWPQMSKISKNEDMIIQFTENMPAFFSDKSYLDMDYDNFYEDLENFFLDYETILSKEDPGDKLIEKYAITPEMACSFSCLTDYIKISKPEFAKGQIVGPFTLATTLVDKDGKCAIYDDTLKEIIIKTLSLKAVWQIKKMKEANPDITPIIFIDEPSISQLGTSAYVSISEDEVLNMIKEVSDTIKSFGALSAIHCCGKCDWKVPIESGVNMLNLDAYSYAQNLSVYAKSVKNFLENNGKIVWGIVPTLDKNALEKAGTDIIENHFNKAVKYLTNKGINEKLIIDNSLVSTSCGAGSLTIELAEKALKLTKEISDRLKERYNDI